MADPNFANVAEQIAFRIDVWDELEKDTTGAGYVTFEESALNDIQGVLAQAARSGIRNDRRSIAAVLEPANINANLIPYLRQMAVAINSPGASEVQSGDDIWEDLYDYMHTNTQYVNSREFSFGSPSAGGGNVGNGSCIRLTKDERGYDLEGWWPDAFTATCEQDARQTGVVHDELWRIEGTDAAVDGLARTGSALRTGLIKAVNARDSQTYVKNPSWNDFTGAAVASTPAVPTALSGWSGYSSLSNFQNDLDITYRATPFDAVSASIRFTTNEILQQDIVDVQKATLDPDTPYYVDVAVYRRDACDGTLTITAGAVSRAVTMTTLNNNAWNRVRLVSTPGANNWARNLNGNTFLVKFQLASRTTGSLHLDDLIFVPFTRIGAKSDARRGRGAMGTYVVFLGGTTPWVRGDTFTFTDTEGTRATNQHWFSWGERGYLPHVTGGTETWADK